MKSAKKKKRLRTVKPGGVKFVPDSTGGERGDVSSLTEAFSSLSMEATDLGCGEGGGSGNKTAEVLGSSVDNISVGDQFKSSTSSFSSGSYSGSCSSEGTSGSSLFEDEFHINGGGGGGSGGKRLKRVVASTGTVSTVLGKYYVMSHQRGDRSTQKGYEDDREPFNVEEMEQFLCSMLGDKSELSMATVKDVLCCCGYDVEKSLDALLKLNGSSSEHSENGRHNHTTNNKNDAGFLFECNPPFLDGVSDSTSFSSENEILDNVERLGYNCRNYAEVLVGSETCSLTGPGSSDSGLSEADPGSTDSDLSQKVLESLFNMTKCSERDPTTMNWRNVVKKMESLGQGIHLSPSDIEESWKKSSAAKGNEYQAFRKDAKLQWDSMRTCYLRAATACSDGKQHSASYLSEQGKVHSKMAREADEKASKEIFIARNRSIENVITIDLHGQHVKQAINLLKAHLFFGAYVHSIQFLKVITGCGTHGVGKSKLKQSVIKLLKREGIEWKEENPGSVLIKLEGHREFGFLDSEDDS